MTKLLARGAELLEVCLERGDAATRSLARDDDVDMRLLLELEVGRSVADTNAIGGHRPTGLTL